MRLDLFAQNLVYEQRDLIETNLRFVDRISAFNNLLTIYRDVGKCSKRSISRLARRVRAYRGLRTLCRL